MIAKEGIRTFGTEIIWDTDRRGTAVSNADVRLSVGEGADWSAEELLATAVGACLMRTILGLATEAGVEILGYVSSNYVDIPAGPEAVPVLRICPCIVVGSEDAARQVRGLCEQAVKSTLNGALRAGLEAAPQITVLVAPAGPYAGF